MSSEAQLTANRLLASSPALAGLRLSADLPKYYGTNGANGTDQGRMRYPSSPQDGIIDLGSVPATMWLANLRLCFQHEWGGVLNNCQCGFAHRGDFPAKSPFFFPNKPNLETHLTNIKSTT
jgi:hypothetical protein